jgi:putative hydrolase of the HAD superfamily
VLVLLDIDDTLLDHTAAERSAATKLHQSAGLPIQLDAFLLGWSAALDQHFGRYLAGEVSFQGQRRDRVRQTIDPDLSDAAADDLFEGYLATYEANWSLFPDVLPCFERVSPRRLGVVSNGQGSQQRRKLARTGIADRFECIVISEEHGYAKPAPDIFLRACALAGESPNNCLYVGDRYETDALAARAAGLTGVWLDRRRTSTAEHMPPVIESLDGLPFVLEALPNKR